MSWTTPLGDDPLSLAVQRARRDTEHARLLAKVAAEALPTRTASGATAGGDERRLRGIPAIGRGVGGEIAGTRPGENL